VRVQREHRDLGFGENGAQALVNMRTARARSSSTASCGVHGGEAPLRRRHVRLQEISGIEVVAEYYGQATDENAQAETAKALAAHPDVNGIFSTPASSAC